LRFLDGNADGNRLDHPWTDDLVTAFQRLAALPEPVT
jgi:hypothetical protein